MSILSDETDLTNFAKFVKVSLMRKILPLFLLVVLLTPLYPVYAQTQGYTLTRPLKTATTTGVLKPQRVDNAIEKRMDKVEDRLLSLKDRMASRAAELRKKLDKFKDKIKAGRLENINTNLNTINSRRTSQMQEVLKKISAVLEKIKAKTTEAGNAGKDVTAINTAIAALETEWAQADAAVKAQAEKDYSVTVNSETTAKDDVSSIRDSLKTDLQATHTQVVEARQALAKALSTALSSISGGSNGTK